MTGGVTLSVSSTSAAAAASGTTANHSAPFLSGSNGLGFGAGGADQAGGAKATTCLATGMTDQLRDSAITIALPVPVTHVGVLWGSIDALNRITMLSNGSPAGSLTGSGVTASPVGDTGAAGTRHVNITSTLAFDALVFEGAEAPFEFDNLTREAIALPGAAGIGLFGAAPLALAAARRRLAC